MSAWKRQKGSSALEIRSLEIAGLCERLLFVLAPPKQGEDRLQVTKTLAAQAEKHAHLRYRAAKGKFAADGVSVPHPVAMDAARHRGQPAMDFQGSIDFLSDAYLGDIVRSVRDLKLYAIRNIRAERAKRGTPQVRNALGRRPNSGSSVDKFTATQKKAIEIDIKAAGKPGNATVVAKRIGVSRQAVSKWRKLPTYQAAVERGVVRNLVDSLLRSLNEKEPSPFEQQLNRVRKNPKPYLDVHVRKHWMGPIVSPFDGKTYATADDYVQHLIMNRLLLHSIIDEIKQATAK